MMSVILHSDLNSFYASVEMMLDPALKGKAVAVCGSTEDRHGIVLAKSELAKKAGVKTGMVTWEAKQKCPSLTVLPPQYEQYLKYSRLTREVYLRYTDQVEPFGMPDFNTVTAGRHFDEMNPAEHETLRYACADSDYTLRLYHKFNDWFSKNLPQHRDIVEQIESPTAVYVGMMKYNGVPMDTASMLVRQAEAEKKLAALRAELDRMTGGVDIGANASTSAFKQYLYTNLALPVLKTTEKHQEAADDATMILLTEYCRENRPELAHLFELVQEYRKWGKLKSTYIDGYLRCVNSATGRIHPDLMSTTNDTPP